MIELIYSGNTYNLPTKFNEVVMEDYMDIMRLDEELKPLEKYIRILSILTGLSEEDIKNINIDQINAISNHIQFLFKSESKLLIEQIKIDGKWYGFNKNLNSEETKFGEYIDLEEFSKPENIKNKLHFLMAMLYRPIKQRKKPSNFENLIKNYIYDRKEASKKYKIEDYMTKTVLDRAELFKKHMKMDVVLGAMFFFSILKMIYMENLKKSLNKKQMMEKLKILMKQLGVNFKKTGDFYK